MKLASGFKIKQAVEIHRGRKAEVQQEHLSLQAKNDHHIIQVGIMEDDISSHYLKRKRCYKLCLVSQRMTLKIRRQSRIPPQYLSHAGMGQHNFQLCGGSTYSAEIRFPEHASFHPLETTKLNISVALR